MDGVPTGCPVPCMGLVHFLDDLQPKKSLAINGLSTVVWRAAAPMLSALFISLWM
jgi:hypothetical protein